MFEIFLEDDESGLLVSNLGRVVGPSGKILKPVVSRYGYGYVASYKSGKYKAYLIHRLVAKLFLSCPPGKTQINHRDENKLNNAVWNLEYCTASYNLEYRNGRQRRLASYIKNGHTNCVTLTNDKETKSFLSYADAARYIGVEKSAIASIFNKQTNSKSANGWHEVGVLLPSANKPLEITLVRGCETRTYHSHYMAAKGIGVHKSHLLMLLAGKERSAKGWHLPGVEPGIVQKAKQFTIKNGVETRTFQSIREASRATGCSRASLSKLIRGRYKQSNGWMLVTPDSNRINN